MLEAEVCGNQMGQAYVKMGFIIALYVRRRVSFCWPQEVPASAFRILRRLVDRSTMLLMCGLNLNMASKVTPRIFGCCSEGIGVSWMVTWGWVWNCLFQGEKKEMLDLLGAMERLLVEAQLRIGFREFVSRAATASPVRLVSGACSAIVTSSA